MRGNVRSQRRGAKLRRLWNTVCCAEFLRRCVCKPPGQPICSNTTTDPYNCGTCGNVCASNYCEGGMCKPCPGTFCSGLCKNTSSDPLNCSTCDNRCSSGTCSGGSCVPCAFTECFVGGGRSCIDTG